jgi:hypothetical protein
MINKTVFVLSVAFGLAFLTPPAITADQSAPAQPPPKAVRQTVNPNVNSITQAAVKAGVLACTSRINQVSNFLTAGSQAVSALLFLPPTNPDNQLLSVSLELTMKDSVAAYASASFAPNQANGCGGVYETVVYWPQKCESVASANFGTLKKIDAFSKNITVLDGGVSTKIFLMPAGTGCVSIKKELVQ